MERTNIKPESPHKIQSPKKDLVAGLGFIFGLTSIPFAFLGIIPITAIILGIWGINRTKVSGSGRWMAVAGLILGIVYLFSNAYMNNHLDFLNSSSAGETTPKLEETSNLTVRLMDMKRISDEEFEISAEITNVSNKSIRALKGTVYIDTIFDEYVTGIEFARTDPLQSNSNFLVHKKIEKNYRSSETFDAYEDLVEAGSIENLKVKILMKEIVF